MRSRKANINTFLDPYCFKRGSVRAGDMCITLQIFGKNLIYVGTDTETGEGLLSPVPD